MLALLCVIFQAITIFTSEISGLENACCPTDLLQIQNVKSQNTNDINTIRNVFFVNSSKNLNYGIKIDTPQRVKRFSWFSNFAQATKNTFENVGKSVEKAANDGMSYSKNAAEGMGKMFDDKINDVVNVGKDIGSSFNIVSNKVNEVKNVFDQPNSIINNVKEVVGKSVEAIKNDVIQEVVPEKVVASIKDFGEQAVLEVGKDAVETVEAAYETVKHTAEAQKHLINGDYKMAEESIKKAPLADTSIKLVETAIAAGNGDWNEVKEKGVEAISSKGFSLATALIPGPAALVTKGAAKLASRQIIRKLAKGSIKKGSNLLKVVDNGKVYKTLPKKSYVQKIKSPNSNNYVLDRKKAANKPFKKDGKLSNEGQHLGDKKKTQKPSESSKRTNADDDRKQKKAKDNDNVERCEINLKRTKRGIKRSSKSDKDPCSKKTKHESSCSEHKVPYAIKKTLRNCKANEVCKYECNDGYIEKSLKCIERDKKFFWSLQKPCELESCGTGNHPVIPLKVPSYSFKALRHKIPYIIQFNKLRKLPDWAMEINDHATINGIDFTRYNYYTQYPCLALKGHQATETDYKLSLASWHHGHLIPANAASWSMKALQFSNSFINIAPQDKDTNNGPWKQLESRIRGMKGVVVTGICSGKETMLNKKIQVPFCFWKMVCYQREGKTYVVGFFSKNSKCDSISCKSDRKKETLTPLSQLELIQRIGGLNGVWSNSIRYLGQFLTWNCALEKNLPAAEKEIWNRKLNM